MKQSPSEEGKETGEGPLKFVINPSDRDWTEDFEHENGNYTNTCIDCKLTFNGHKRRVICKLCATPNWLEISKKKRPEDNKDNKAWAGAWLEGEMVGYAKCMVEKVTPLESKLNELEKSDQEALANAWENGFKTREEWIGLSTPKPKNPHTKD